MKPYPIKFEPILQEKLWGGNKLKHVFNKTDRDENFGESWELSNVEGFSSVVTNGELKNQSFSEVLKHHHKEILGPKVSGSDFPLLIKFLDAKIPLSLQVHPDDERAKIYADSRGKTEMWIILSAEPDAKIYLDWANSMTKEKAEIALKDGSIMDYVKTYDAQPGDCFFVPAGTVHAIGKGIVLAEIQQTSDSTYRLFDWNRVDKNGNPRDLHIEESLRVMDWNPKENLKKYFTKELNQLNPVVNEKHFKTSYLPLEGSFELENKYDSFQILICTEGFGEIQWENEILAFQKGDTLLLPFALNKVSLISENGAALIHVHL
ncbi:Probable mannose-6-phosphate isomerase gmuF [Candidatus Ornithobacterium hominis]|uniref:Phosphohexomutase n=1 Tax=Candidatus Ornithobacterium hominis TaxID=2497989 RepID=A0A383TYP9_9FLAO|nr:type I phosphomannose isomerase catalytic subunit [Candidatus Ornithobacterium hominis]MCT7903986.1 class I mannose-6-phosphate isomerase [Candidatus Ornithobacterium hominis]SZD72477.1 Probable mannose-6-phosphate isomerase gmuF [Candidatus Ornithobacterium hominis]SZD72811.1 Probable mannose-6-phosphate isomerase gmuF [Candidatus Ornithobacterium hominis]